jgi:hypothetical protein
MRSLARPFQHIVLDEFMQHPALSPDIRGAPVSPSTKSSSRSSRSTRTPCTLPDPMRRAMPGLA